MDAALCGFYFLENANLKCLLFIQNLESKLDGQLEKAGQYTWSGTIVFAKYNNDFFFWIIDNLEFQTENVL